MLRERDGQLEFEQLVVESVHDAFTTDASTGESIETEIEAIYCGPNERILEEST